MAFCDFEASLQNAIYGIFNIEIKGCWFHFNQAIIRKLFNLGFKMRFCNDIDFKLWVRRFGALALIPVEKIMEAWAIIINTIPGELNTQIIKFLNYFINTWILGKQGATMTVNVWNLYNLEGDRTNNVLEGNHSGANKQIKPHSDIYQVIKYFKTNESENSLLFIQMQQGNVKKKESKSLKDRKKDENLTRIQLSYKNKEVEFPEYFNQVSHQVTFPYGEKVEASCEINEIDDEKLMTELNEDEDEIGSEENFKLAKNTKTKPIANPFKKSTFFTDSLLKKKELITQSTTNTPLINANEIIKINDNAPENFISAHICNKYSTTTTTEECKSILKPSKGKQKKSIKTNRQW
jgi:hypothetical protein